MKPFKTILHPTDFSEHSELALRLAAALARDHRCRLVILHVVPSAAPIVGAGDIAQLDRGERYQRELKVYQEEMKARLRQLKVPDKGIQVEYLFKEGDVAKLILRAAEEVSCDLIVMGTLGKSGFLRAVVGSVAEEIGRKAPCPVVTARLPRPQQEPVETVSETAAQA
jgi:nucleotide-binding universal stress UspA family protein